MPDRSYITVVEGGNSEELMELPLEEDGSMLISTLTAQFPGACGLKYKPVDSKAYRGLRVEEGRIYLPEDPDEWSSNTFVAVFPRSSVDEKKSDAGKRKMQELEAEQEGFLAAANKMSRLSGKPIDLIVLGISYNSSPAELKAYFEQYGEVLVCEIKKDANGKSRGFGFVRFKEVSAQKEVLRIGKHFIDGRQCDVKLPNSKLQMEQGNSAARKVFIGQMPESVTVEMLHEYFGKFGEITDVYIPKPHRHFAFVTFDDSDVSQSLYGTEHKIGDATVTVNPAAPKNTGMNSAKSRDMNPSGPGMSSGGNPMGGMGSAMGGGPQPQDFNAGGPYYGGYAGFGFSGPGGNMGGGGGMGGQMAQMSMYGGAPNGAGMGGAPGGMMPGSMYGAPGQQPTANPGMYAGYGGPAQRAAAAWGAGGGQGAPGGPTGWMGAGVQQLNAVVPGSTPMAQQQQRAAMQGQSGPANGMSPSARGMGMMQKMGGNNISPMVKQEKQPVGAYAQPGFGQTNPMANMYTGPNYNPYGGSWGGSS